MKESPDGGAVAGTASKDSVSTDRRELVKKGLLIAAAGCAIALGGAYSAGLFDPPRPAAPGNGPMRTYGVTWSTSGATSAWANDKEGQPMRASDFPNAGLGA